MSTYHVLSTLPVVAVWAALIAAGVYANTKPRRRPLVHAAAPAWIGYVAQHAAWPAPLSPRLTDQAFQRNVPAADIIARLRWERSHESQI